MRLSALLALVALTGLAGCDSAKMSELTGAKPQAAQTVAIGGRPAVTGPTACPPSPQPACPPAQPAMAPEAPKAALPAATAGAAPAKHWAKPRHIAWRAGHPARPMARRHDRVIVKKVVIVREVAAPVRHNAYADGYVEHHYERRFVTPPPAYGPPPPHYVAPPPAYRGPPPAYGRDDDDRRAQGYERHESYDGRAEGYGREEHYERVVPPHGVYVEEHRDDRYGGHQAYAYQRSESERESYSYRESGSANGAYSRPDDCGCQTQAAGRDRRGFLTWPGKQP